MSPDRSSEPTRHELASVEERSDGTWFVAKCSCGRGFGSPKRERVEARVTSHAADANRATCPHPDKTAYRSEAEAARAMPGLWQMLRGGPSLRAYKCRCGRWHLTSKPDRNNRRLP